MLRSRDGAMIEVIRSSIKTCPSGPLTGSWRGLVFGAEVLDPTSLPPSAATPAAELWCLPLHSDRRFEHEPRCHVQRITGSEHVSDVKSAKADNVHIMKCRRAVATLESRSRHRIIRHRIGPASQCAMTLASYLESACEMALGTPLLA